MVIVFIYFWFLPAIPASLSLTNAFFQEEGSKLIETLSETTSEPVVTVTSTVSTGPVNHCGIMKANTTMLLLFTTRIGDPKETTSYVRIPVIIEINPTKSIASLTYFVYDIETYEKLLLISDLDITAPNMRTPTEGQGSLTVTGFTRKSSPPKAKGKEG